MSRWHPIYAGADPGDAWYTAEKLAEFRRAEAIDRAIALRDRFEDAVRRLDHPPPTPEEINALWHQGDPDHATD